MQRQCWRKVDRAMLKFILRRLVLAMLTLWVASVVVFFSARITGSPEHAMMPPDAYPEDREAFRRAYGLDKPLIEQYFRWLSRALQGDLGKGIQYKVPVTGLIWQRLIRSLELTSVAILMAIILAIPLGVLAATKRGQVWDHIATAIGVSGQALPSFWLGMMLVLLFAVILGVLPASGAGTWKHYIMPGFTIGYFVTAGAMRLVRSSMPDVLDSEFVKLARAKGMPEYVVIWKHALKNALIPVVTFIGYMFGVMIAASIVVETVFNWPGIGRLVFEALLLRDFPVVQGVVLVWSSIIVLLNLLVDILYVILDPRIRT